MLLLQEHSFSASSKANSLRFLLLCSAFISSGAHLFSLDCCKNGHFILRIMKITFVAKYKCIKYVMYITHLHSLPGFNIKLYTPMLSVLIER